MTALEAVLWDMDGTLIDSEPVWARAVGAVAADLGVSLSPDARSSLAGMHAAGVGEMLEHAGAPLDARSIGDCVVEHVARAHMAALTWRPGAVELLLELRSAGVRQALVTMSTRRLADIVLARLPASVFDAVVTVQDVVRPKPAPEAFVVAAARMGVDVAACAVIEDSAVGVASGVLSGAGTIAVPSGPPVLTEGAAAVWPSLVGRSHDDVVRVVSDHRQHMCSTNGGLIA